MAWARSADKGERGERGTEYREGAAEADRDRGGRHKERIATHDRTQIHVFSFFSDEMFTIRMTVALGNCTGVPL